MHMCEMNSRNGLGRQLGTEAENSAVDTEGDT